VRDTGALVTSARSESQPSNDDHGRAALGYLVWPIALLDLLRSDGETFWSRLHARQAAFLGVFGTIVFLAALALPLILIVAWTGIGTRATIVLYSIGIAVDLVVGASLAIVSIVYAARASKGELFAIPVVTRLCDRFFPIART
jgi:uncharacterized membrane protein